MTSLVLLHCIECGVPYGVTQGHLDILKRDGAWFQCPNGHRQRYTETEADRMRKQRDSARDAMLAAQRERDEARAALAKKTPRRKAKR